jgi:hypothetical protein
MVVDIVMGISMGRDILGSNVFKEVFQEKFSMGNQDLLTLFEKRIDIK